MVKIFRIAIMILLCHLISYNPVYAEFFCYSTGFAGEDALLYEATLILQTQKLLYGGEPSLKGYFGRADFAARYYKKGLATGCAARLYPLGAGRGYGTDDDVDRCDAGGVRFSLQEAWISYLANSLKIRIGRFSSEPGPSALYGNYVDCEPADGAFLRRISFHTGIEADWECKITGCSVILGATRDNDREVHGYIRISQWIFLAEKIKAIAFYRGNVFDLLRKGEKVAEYSMAARINYSLIPGVDLFWEAAYRQSSAKVPFSPVRDFAPVKQKLYMDFSFSKGSDVMERDRHGEALYPVYFGISLAVVPGLDSIAVDAEFNSNRKVDGQDRAVDMTLCAVKSIGNRFRLNAGIGSDPHAPQMEYPLFSVRLTLFLFHS